MRKRKIRGFNRILRQIEYWRIQNLGLNLNFIEEYQRYYVKISVRPWSNISIINSNLPEPKGKAKKLILEALLDIYESWKIQLDKINKPYYLRLWIFDPRFSKSQVVFALGDYLTFYDNAFFVPDTEKEIQIINYPSLKKRLNNFAWEYRLDEDHFDNTFVGDPNYYDSFQDYKETKKWFNKLLKTTHRLTLLAEPIEDIIETYSFKRGDLWIGNYK